MGVVAGCHVVGRVRPELLVILILEAFDRSAGKRSPGSFSDPPHSRVRGSTPRALSPALGPMADAPSSCDHSGLPSNRWRASPHYCCSDGVHSRGAAMTNLSQRASFRSFESIKPWDQTPNIAGCALRILLSTKVCNKAHRKVGCTVIIT